MKKFIKCLSVFVLCFIFTINGVKAKSYIKDLFQVDEELEIKEELNGTSFLAGTKVTVESDIKGIGFIAGETLNINGKEEYLFSIGTTQNINGNVANDAFIFGTDTSIKGEIGRDLYIFSSTLNIEGNINRNSYIYATKVDIKGTINGNITINALEINIDENAKILGTIRYNDDAVINGLNENIISKTYKNNVQNFTLLDYVTAFIEKYIHITLVAIVLVFIVEKLFIKSLEQTKNYNTKKLAILCGKGFLILIGVPIIAMMLLFSGAFISVGIIGSIIYVILIYISNIFTAYFVATELDKKYFKKKMNNYILMIIGLFILSILSIIPIIGSIISLISMLLGLGIVGNMIIELKNN